MYRARGAAVAAAVFVAGLVAAPAMAQGSGGKTTTASAAPHKSPTHRASIRTSSPAPATAAAKAPDVVVNEFMSYDPAAKKVKLVLDASLTSDNGGMNFNGGSRGSQTITVPLGWSVHVDFLNKDAIPHSAIILPDKMPLPMAPDRPAIARAFTRDLTGGIPTDGKDTMDFTATPAGSYLIVCGVPGHGPSGMYIKFDVSASAKTPAYKK